MRWQSRQVQTWTFRGGAVTDTVSEPQAQAAVLG